MTIGSSITTVSACKTAGSAMSIGSNGCGRFEKENLVKGLIKDLMDKSIEMLVLPTRRRFGILSLPCTRRTVNELIVSRPVSGLSIFLRFNLSAVLA